MSVHFCNTECALVKEKSFFHKYAYRYRDESTLMNAFSPSLPYIFLFIPVREVSECYDFSHSRHELFAGCASQHQRRRTRGEGKREERGRGGEQDTTVKRLKPAQGWDAGLVSKQRQQRSLRLKAGGRRWQTGGNHQWLTAVLIQNKSNIEQKAHPQSCIFFFLIWKGNKYTTSSMHIYFLFGTEV